MKKFLPSSLIRALLFLILSSSWGYGEDMMKIVYRYDMPEKPADSFVLKPRTLYMCGLTKSRLEEMPDPQLKLHGLMIGNEKDIWIINLWDKTGKHLIDPGPTYGFHAPIVPSERGEKPGRGVDFELGHELAFMEKRKVEPKKTVVEGKDLLLYECGEIGLTLRLYVLPETQVPWSVSVHEGEKLLVQIRYDEYVLSLPLDESLFAPPAGIKISEVADEAKGG